jgi:tripartite-type tricarboxylate transporter receptor subunit TctC
MINRRELVSVLVAAAVGRVAWAQTWPARAVRIISPLAAGGGIDATARILAARLSEIWGRQAVVENRTGASGNIAAEYVARSEPDGYTLYITSFSHATNRFLYPSLGYDPIADFVPVTLIATYPLIMVVPISSPAHSVKEFIAYAKSKRLSYASSGNGTSLHLAAELFMRKAGIEMTHVPYRS